MKKRQLNKIFKMLHLKISIYRASGLGLVNPKVFDKSKVKYIWNYNYIKVFNKLRS